MVKAIDAQGHMVYVSYIRDCESNGGGYWCNVYAYPNLTHEIDGFCIYPDDCDCSDPDVVEAFIEGFISVQEYDL